MRSVGYHFRIVSLSGEVLHDSAKFRVNRYSTADQAYQRGRSLLNKGVSFNRPGYTGAEISVYPDPAPKPQPFTADLTEVVFKFNGGALKVVTRPPFTSFSVWRGERGATSEPIHVYGVRNTNTILADIAQAAVEEAIEFHAL